MCTQPSDPAAFRARQQDLLGQASACTRGRRHGLPPRCTAPPPLPPPPPASQAAALDAFLVAQKCETQQRQTRADWLLAQHRLEQEAADAEAELAAIFDGGGVAGALECLPPACEPDAAPADGCLGADAISSAAALGTLSARTLADRPGEAQLASLQQRITAAPRDLQQQLGSLQAVASELLRDVQQAQRGAASGGCTANDAEGLGSRGARLCAEHPLVPAGCIRALCTQSVQLEARHAQQREERLAAWRRFLAGTGGGGSAAPDAGATACSSGDSCTGGGACWPDGSAECDSGSTAGWSADEHTVFLHARPAAGGSDAALVRQLAAMLPHRSGQEVRAHERWHKEASRLQAAAHQGEDGARAEGAVFMSAAAALLGEATVARLDEAEAALRRLDAAAASVQVGEALQQQREACEERAVAEEQAQLVAAAAEAAQHAQERRAKEDYNARLKLLLAEHAERQEAAAAAAAVEEQAAAAAAARGAAVAAAAGKLRVQHRAQQLANRRAQLAAREEVARREQERRQQALDRLARAVAPALARDAVRATGPTASSAAMPVQAGQRQLFVSLGFTADQVMADQRARVFEALHQMGLHQTVAGRAAVAGARPAAAPRPDTLTSAQRQGMLGG